MLRCKVERLVDNWSRMQGEDFGQNVSIIRQFHTDAHDRRCSACLQILRKRAVLPFFAYLQLMFKRTCKGMDVLLIYIPIVF